MTTRKQKRNALVAGLLSLGALAVIAAVLWRWLATSPSDAIRTTLPAPAATVTAPPGEGRQGGEDFSAAERQRLENILRQKKPNAQR